MNDKAVPVYSFSSSGNRGTLFLIAETRFVVAEKINRSMVFRLGRLFDVFSDFSLKENGKVIATGVLEGISKWTVTPTDDSIDPFQIDRSTTKRPKSNRIDGGPDSLMVITKTLRRLRPNAAPRSTAGSSAKVAKLEAEVSAKDAQVAKLEALLEAAGVEVPQ